MAWSIPHSPSARWPTSTRTSATLAESMKRDREAAAAKNANPLLGNAGGFGSASRGSRMFGRGGPSGVDGRSPLKLCLLLRLGRADLAEVLFAAGTTWTPEVRGRDLTDYHISYLTLASDWATAVFIRLVTAHVRGDDVIALDAARRLSAFAKAVKIKAEAMGFQRDPNRFNNGDPSYLASLRQLPDLLADHERRAKEPARGPIPQRGGDPSARIAALIRDLDQIDDRQMSSPGWAYPGRSSLVVTADRRGRPCRRAAADRPRDRHAAHADRVVRARDVDRSLRSSRLTKPNSTPWRASCRRPSSSTVRFSDPLWRSRGRKIACPIHPSLLDEEPLDLD